MLIYYARRTARAAVTLVLALLVVFIGVRSLPGDFAVAMAGNEGTPETIEAIRQLYGLDQPVWIQFLRYVELLLQGDMGRSASTGLPVAEVIGRAMPATIQLAVLAMAVAVVIGVLFGIVAAVRQGKAAEWIVNLSALLGLSIPNFWLGLMAILLLSVLWPVFPASGYVSFVDDPIENLRRMVMPATVLGTAFAAIIMRQTRSAMLESLEADYVRTAKAKGLSSRRVVVGHALRNSLVVVITVVGLQLGGLISGAVITEQVFVIPGLGKLTIDAVFTRDYPMIQGVVLVVAVAYIVINLLTDVFYSVIDPRIRVKAART